MTRRHLITALLFVAAFPASVAFGVAVAAFFGPEIGKNMARYALGFMDGMLLFGRVLPRSAPASEPVIQ
jgi:hypothetical protein